MNLEVDDEELSDLREALRVQLLRLLKDLARAESPRHLSQVRTRYQRLEGLYRRLDGAPAAGLTAVTH